MEVIFLGTSAGAPTLTRNVQSAAVRLDGNTTILVDCGEATQHQIQRYNTISQKKIRHVSTVLVTHLHGDHVFGLPGLLCFLDAAAPSSNEAPIRVVGPCGLAAFLRVTLGLSRTELPNRGYFVLQLCGAPAEAVPPSSEATSPPSSSPPSSSPPPPLHGSERADLSRDVAYEDGWRVGDVGGVDVEAAPLDHAGMPCVAYALTEQPRRGKVDAAAVVKAARRANDDPKRIFAALDRDFVDLTDGSRFPLSAAFVGGKKRLPGRKLVVFGDCRRLPEPPRLARNADLIVHEATLDDSLAELAFSRGHSTPSDAGRLARDANAQALVLWHFSPRYGSGDPAWRDTFLRSATNCDDAHQRNDDDDDDSTTTAARGGGGGGPFPGTVTLANDFDVVSVPPPREVL